VRRDEYHRNLDARLDQAALKIEAVHLRKPYIKN